MSFMDVVKKSYAKVSKEIKTKPRVCEICRKKETMHDLILKYDNGKFMCDDCAFNFFENLDKYDNIKQVKEITKNKLNDLEKEKIK